MAVRPTKSAAANLKRAGYSERAAELGSATPAEVLPANIAEAVAAERLRIIAILDNPEAVSRPALARQLALHSNMSADQAATMLAAVPPEAPAAVDHSRIASAFAKAMEATAEQINIRPALGDKKATRLEEIKATGRAYGEAKGYRRASNEKA